MTININRSDDLPGPGRGGEKPPRPPVSPPKKPLPRSGNLGGSPGLVTSTGGLYGVDRALLIPFFDSKYNNTSLQIIDSDNFDTEEDAFYYFPSPDIKTGRAVTVHNVVLIYREIGLATFQVGVIVYVRKTDKFEFIERELKITNVSPKTNKVNPAFPDQKLHTRYADINISGERPQAYLRRSADSGPLSIISLTMAGHADVPLIM